MENISPEINVQDSEPSPDEYLKKVLIADDSVFVRNCLSAILNKENFAIIEAANGYEAIEKGIKELPDLILMDLSMPGLDGFKAAETLKNHTRSKHIPIIVITALATKEHVIQGKQIGIAGFLVKPFDIDDLCNTITRVLQL